MSLYRKHLKNMDELRREQRAVRKKQKKLGKEPLVSVQSIRKDSVGLAGTGLSMLGTVLAGQTGIAGVALPIVIGLLKTKVVKRTAGNALKGVAGGYLKWKALTLGLRMAKSILFKKKEDTEKKGT
jgi:hypothetical protein